MKQNTLEFQKYSFSWWRMGAIRLTGFVGLSFALIAPTALQAASVWWKASNVAVYHGLPSTALEFENPLSGVEAVISYPVLEWRDADFSWGPPVWYDDWTPSSPTGIDGNANEIWMRQSAQSIQTTTTVPSTTVSVHMTGDSNDGLAAVAVDNVQIAALDMYSTAGSQSVLLIIKGLPNTTHVIQVSDNGPGQGGGDDVHVFGAAALQESKLKWDQPPVTANPTNIFYGWNEPSTTNMPPVIADDWVCTTASPVTKIRWWGSFLGWTSNSLPPFLPNAFQITIWSDLPAAPGGYSQPDVAKWQTHCTTFRASFAGWDFDPRAQKYEACFLFEQDLPTNEWFYQEPGPTGTNIYWVSIGAEYWQGLQGPIWGWKTRPRDLTSPAPDDAVRILAPEPWFIQPGVVCTAADPIWWPDPTNSWDLAFELISSEEVRLAKWEQPPDLSNNGIDVNATGWTNTQPPVPPYLLADDFLCTNTGPITNITVWGSWFHDYHDYGVGPSNMTITLSIHDDIPAGAPPYYMPWSMPGPVKWLRTFTPAQYKCTVHAGGLLEGWLDPPAGFIWPGDFTCFQYDFSIPTGYFVQQGSPATPMTYWLDVQANLPYFPSQTRFGWKTSVSHWNDAAVWVQAKEAWIGPWQNLTYPPGHAYEPTNIDLAFRLNSVGEQQEEVKWSQPPELYHPTDAYNGWNEESVMGTPHVVADDWVCTNASPVTDIHWWGSFLGWSDANPPQIPEAFRILFWTDIPAGPVQPYSQPGNIVHEIVCTNFTWQFVGWDIDPRDPNAPPEACFKFEQDLLENEWFRQDPADGTNIYWVSIEAAYMSGQIPEFPFGWKTRPRDPTSLAPDDAVRILDWPLPPICEPIWWPYETNSWDLAFALTTKEIITPTNDFGDAPSPYPTLLPAGAQHAVNPAVLLGPAIDAELNGLPHPNALGDDLSNLADEDGVVLTSSLVPGEQANVQVTASANGFLSAWIDFGTDGSWAEAGDQIFNNVNVAAGVQTISFPVPFTAARGTNTFARFRFSTANIGGFTGQATDGEVEDYQWRLEQLDFGDAQDPGFATYFANNGARHVVTQGAFLGALIDSEYDGQPNANATGDNLVNLKDEDGVQLTTPLLPGQNATVRVTASMAGVVNAWIDFGADGSWAEAGDQIASAALVVAGPNLITFPVPTTAAAGNNVFARFRYTTMAGLPGLGYTGLALNGEVEDYYWKIDQADFGDAPDGPYPTKLPNCAQHVIGTLYLGTGVDAELDGQPNASASGDDLTLSDDEDGVFFPTALIANVPANIQVVSTGGGLLQGWFDFNIDGDWADLGEQAIVNRPLIAGTNLVSFFMPNALAGKSFARFRFSTVTNLTYVGLAPDGEVEDYEVTFLPLKWTQQPELGKNGVDVNDSVALADDFQCTQSGPVTDVHIWGSFWGDILPQGGPGNMNVTLTFYRDVPFGPGGYSQPGQAIWTQTFNPRQFAIGQCFNTGGEWWHDPAALPPIWQPNADLNIWQLDFYMPAASAFQQVSNTIYWLGVQYTPVGTDTNYNFGWKTSYIQWNDAACWYNQLLGAWSPLLYGDGHPQAQSQPPFNRMNFAFALSTEDLDWGDAPDPTYPTLAANGGACHRVVPGLMLGSLIDSEGDGQPNVGSTGDDISNLPDEDGVAALPLLIPGQPTTVTVTVTGSGFLNAWVDFGADGSWAQSSDRIVTDLALTTGTYPVTFMVSSNAAWGQTTIARFRFCTLTNIPFAGYAPDGEVEDYSVGIHAVPTPDLGDAPDSSNGAGRIMTAYPPAIPANYPTVFVPGLAPFGPMHANIGYALGFTRSGEVGADWGADQDLVNNILPMANTADLDGSDDGLVGPATFPHCSMGKLTVMVSLPVPMGMFLNVWCDWNRDGDWDDALPCPDGMQATEWACQNLPVNASGMITVPIRAWHPSLAKQPIWIRVTLAEMAVPGTLGFSGVLGGGGDGPPGGYQFGETEDYYLTNYDDLQGFDWGDAPSPFPTLQSANGAQHQFVLGFCLGGSIDLETNGQPHALALGDDLNAVDDEDGIQFLGPLLAGSNAYAQVLVTSGTAGGRLDAWVDFNGNNSWLDGGEQVFASLAVPAGLSTNAFSVPVTAKLGTNFARFRLSSTGGLASTGAVQDGEVEDYLLILNQPRPATNIVITNIVVTNLFVTNQVVGLAWTFETNVHYQVRAADALSSTNMTWYDVGPIIIGPNHWYWETNSVRTQKFYRVIAPFTWP